MEKIEEQVEYIGGILSKHDRALTTIKRQRKKHLEMDSKLKELQDKSYDDQKTIDDLKAQLDAANKKVKRL